MDTRQVHAYALTLASWSYYEPFHERYAYLAYLGFYNKCLLSDIDTVDNLLGGLCYPHHRLERLIFIVLTVTESFRYFALNFSTVLGAIILISIVLPWFLIPVFVVFIAYLYTALFYLSSSRDFKVCFIFDKRFYLMYIYNSVLVSTKFSWSNIG